jgi:hypothetical protein
MKNLLLAAVLCLALLAIPSAANGQCGYHSYGYRTYYRPAPVVVVPSYGYGPGFYSYGYPGYSYRAYYGYGGNPVYRTYYGGTHGYGYGWGYPRSGISIVVGM